MDRYYHKSLSLKTVIISILCSVLLCGCNTGEQRETNLIFRYKAINDSLHVFMNNVKDFPEAKGPTRIYIYTFCQEGHTFVTFQSYPGFIATFASRDTTSDWGSKVGLYRGKYVRVWYSSQTEYLFNNIVLSSIHLEGKDKLFLKENPGYSGEIIDLYFQEITYEVSNPRKIARYRNH